MARTAHDQTRTAPNPIPAAPAQPPVAPARRVMGPLAGLAATVAVIVAGVVAITVVHLLPHIRNPFAESTTMRSQPTLLKSITSLSRYQAASGSFQVIVDLSRKTQYLPSFLEGSQTVFVGQAAGHRPMTTSPSCAAKTSRAHPAGPRSRCGCRSPSSTRPH